MTTHDSNTIRRIAVEAVCDPRSVDAYLRGDPLRPLTATRIKAALKKLRISDPNLGGAK